MNDLKYKNNRELIDNFLNKKNIFAVVGVSKNIKKYGYQVYKDLKNAGYQVYPVNPNVESILGDKCYVCLSDLPVKPDVVDIVVPSEITFEIVKECNKLEISKVWMQPGSELEESIDYCKDKNIDVLHNVCIIIERGKK